MTFDLYGIAGHGGGPQCHHFLHAGTAAEEGGTRRAVQLQGADLGNDLGALALVLAEHSNTQHALVQVLQCLFAHIGHAQMQAVQADVADVDVVGLHAAALHLLHDDLGAVLSLFVGIRPCKAQHGNSLPALVVTHAELERVGAGLALNTADADTVVTHLGDGSMADIHVDIRGQVVGRIVDLVQELLLAALFADDAAAVGSLGDLKGIIGQLCDGDLDLNYGETLGLVGETGAGKTTTALSVIQLLPEGIGFVTDGSIKLDGVDMLNAPEEKIRAMRGSVVSMIFQDPMSALNPVMTVGAQIMEVLKIHHPEQSTAQLEARVDEMMELVGIPAKRKVEYPHQFSGGMKQRIVIAIALACEPKLILADEPTTALDVTIQAQMLGLINELQKRLNTAMILITHDLGVVAQTCEKVMVMYAGEAIEYGTAEDIFETTQRHPYTQGLFNAIPKLDENTKRLEAIEGMMADPTQKIEGCRFADRCKYATAACKKAQKMREVTPGHFIRCCRFDPPQSNT